MANKAINWAWEQDCRDDQTLRLLLVALCDHANEHDYCWPSQQLLAAKCLVSVKTIQRKLLELEKLGFIEQRRRARKTSIYLITLNKTSMKRHPVSYHDDDATDDATKQADDATNSIDDATLESPSNLHLEPPIINPIESGFLFQESDAPKKQPKRARRAPMSETWQPDSIGIAFARDRGFTDDKIRQLIVACRDYHLKHGTLIAGSLGLSATWRTWINNEIKFTQERRNRYAHRNETTSFDDRIRNLVDEARRLEDQAGVVRPSDAFRSH